MYCAKCGVELAATEKACPLCRTAAHPDLMQRSDASLYPKEQLPSVQVNTLGIMMLLTILFAVPSLVCLLCDLPFTGRITWSGYVIGALLCLYVIAILPLWFRNPNPVVFVPCSFAAVGFYLLHISIATEGGWFLTFAFPVLGFFCLVVSAVVTLLRYVRRGTLYVLGGALCAVGGFMPLMGYLMNLTFYAPGFALWSLCPMAVLILLGLYLIFLAICRPAREMMQRKFFI